MITASHNPHYDNGVKIIRPDGEMLHVEDEKRLEDFVNEFDIIKGVDIIKG